MQIQLPSHAGSLELTSLTILWVGPGIQHPIDSLTDSQGIIDEP